MVKKLFIAGAVIVAVIVMGFSVLLVGLSAPPPQAEGRCAIPVGNLPNKVPEPINGLATKAAKHYNVDPMPSSLMYYSENYQGEGIWRKPPPPYGRGPAWPVSIMAAAGPLQIVPGTWMMYRFSNPAHQPGNVNDLTDALYAANHYIKDLGGKPRMTFGSIPANHTIANVMAKYNAGPGAYLQGFSQTRIYVNRAHREYNRLMKQKQLDANPEAAQKAAKKDRIENEICAPIGTTQQARVALAAAKKELGKPYIFGATGPNSFDCSGLMLWSLHKAGIDLPRTAAEQYHATRQWTVDPKDAQPGDLVFFVSVGTRENPGHVGMVVDPIKKIMINAPFPGSHVRYDTYDTADMIAITHPYIKDAKVPNPSPSAKK